MNYIALFGIAFIVGLVLGLILFDILITRPMVMQLVKEHREQLEKERHLAQIYMNELEKYTNSLNRKNG